MISLLKKNPPHPFRRYGSRKLLPLAVVTVFVDNMAADDKELISSATLSPICEGCQETSYLYVRVLGRGAFGQAVLYRKTEVTIFRTFWTYK